MFFNILVRVMDVDWVKSIVKVDFGISIVIDSDFYRNNRWSIVD